MSKTKAFGPGHYEILFIIPNKFTEDEAKGVIGKIKESITAANGEITYDEYWGKKKLAYPIKSNNHGYYALYEFDLPTDKLAKLNTDFCLSTDILRFQIVKKKKKTKEEIAKAKEIAEKINSKKEDEKIEEIEKAEKKVVTKKKVEKKVDISDLDKKLEGILDANDLL
jgi:small subunit ribosomal protein S6